MNFFKGKENHELFGNLDKVRFVGEGYNKEEVSGLDSFSLQNAYVDGFVKHGDIIEIDTPKGKERLIYLGPDKFSLGEQHFLPERPYMEMPCQIIYSDKYIGAWKKIGHKTPAEWNAEMDLVQLAMATEYASW